MVSRSTASDVLTAHTFSGLLGVRPQSSGSPLTKCINGLCVGGFGCNVCPVQYGGWTVCKRKASEMDWPMNRARREDSCVGVGVDEAKEGSCFNHAPVVGEGSRSGNWG